MPLDVHLMIENPDYFAPRYGELGAQSVTFHVEAAHDVAATIALHPVAWCQSGNRCETGNTTRAVSREFPRSRHGSDHDG